MAPPSQDSGERDVLLGRCLQGIEDLKGLVQTDIELSRKEREGLDARISLLEKFQFKTLGWIGAFGLATPVVISLVINFLTATPNQ